MAKLRRNKIGLTSQSSRVKMINYYILKNYKVYVSFIYCEEKGLIYEDIVLQKSFLYACC